MALRDQANRGAAVLHCGPLTATVTRIARNRLLIELLGELDSVSVNQLERRLFLPRRAEIDLDLSRLTYIDPTGIRFLTMVAGKKGGKTRLTACSTAARRALELSGLERFVQGPAGRSRRGP